ncbi:Hypothetical protein PBC10988_19560 [Planctomycetales bacterium 10988]|nr:Hypothetical protein PBC10988_19560 [Planctomycetales bacterium 10988]
MQPLPLLERVRLIPIIELDPWAFEKHERPRPDGSLFEVLQQWQEFWVAALADSGLTGLEAIQPGSWQVPIQNLSDRQLEIILDAELKKLEIEDIATCEIDELVAFSGGFALWTEEEGAIYEPQCCGDLKDLASWKEAAIYQKGNWEMLWIGHPWLSYRYENGFLQLSDLHEDTEPIAKWQISSEILADAVSLAEIQRHAFVEQLELILKKRNLNRDTKPLASTLAGLIA